MNAPLSTDLPAPMAPFGAKQRMHAYLEALGFDPALRTEVIDEVLSKLEREPAKLTNRVAAAMRTLDLLLQQKSDTCDSVRARVDIAYEFGANRDLANRSWSMPAMQRQAMAPKDHAPTLIKALRQRKKAQAK